MCIFSPGKSVNWLTARVGKSIYKYPLGLQQQVFTESIDRVDKLIWWHSQGLNSGGGACSKQDTNGLELVSVCENSMSTCRLWSGNFLLPDLRPAKPPRQSSHHQHYRQQQKRVQLPRLEREDDTRRNLLPQPSPGSRLAVSYLSANCFYI